MVTFLSPVEAQMRAMFPPESHPNRVLERANERFLTPTSAVLDIGCGRTAPNLVKLAAPGRMLYGIDVIDFTVAEPAHALALRRPRETALDDAESSPAAPVVPPLSAAPFAARHPAEPAPAGSRPFDMPSAVRASELNPAEWPPNSHAPAPASALGDDPTPFGSLLNIKPTERPPLNPAVTASAHPAVHPVPNSAAPDETEAALRQALVTLQQMSSTG